MRYKGRIYQIGPDGSSHEVSKLGFETKEEAFEWAKEEAYKLAGSTSYWVEYQRSNILNKFSGHIRL